MKHRNITGELTKEDSQGQRIVDNEYSGSDNQPLNAILSKRANTSLLPGGTSEGYGWAGFTFDASRVIPTSNENRPYNIAMLPLIAY